jgi:oligopeptide/dipeptide ABC transporter ATP-binding protein
VMSSVQTRTDKDGPSKSFKWSACEKSIWVAIRMFFRGPVTAHWHCPGIEALFSSLPVAKSGAKRERIIHIRGSLPSPANPPSGCTFHPRCAHATDLCKTAVPPLLNIRDGQQVSCHLYQEGTIRRANNH